MTLESKIRKLMRKRLKSAFSFTCDRKHGLVAIDLMQWVKVLPEEERLNTIDQVVTYLVRRCLSFFTRDVGILVVCFDRWTPPVKRLICHDSR